MEHNNTARPTLSYDGHGINGPDIYRSRIATFTDGAAAREWGALLASAPDLAREVGQLRAENARLREALQGIAEHADEFGDVEDNGTMTFRMTEKARAALASDARTEGGA